MRDPLPRGSRHGSPRFTRVGPEGSELMMAPIQPHAYLLPGGVMSDKERLRDPIKVAAAMIVNSVVHQEYASVARMTGGRFLSAGDLERIVAKHA
jgi:hypothetical protein